MRMPRFSTWSFTSGEQEVQAAYESLWQHMIQVATADKGHGKLQLDKSNPDAHAFFLALELAFTRCDKMEGIIPVDQELMVYMAAWSRDAVGGMPNMGGPRDEHCLRRAFRGFYETLRNAVRLNHLRYFSNGRVLFGCFEVPQWFIDNCFDEMYQQALRDNRLWNELHHKACA